MAAALRDAAPETMVERSGDSLIIIRGEAEAMLNLTSLTASLNQAADEDARRAILENYVSVHLDAGAEADLSGGKLMPVLRHRDFTRREAYGSVGETILEADRPVWRAVAADTVMMLVADTPTSAQYVSPAMLADAGLSEDAAFERAAANLERYVQGQLQIGSAERFKVVGLDGFYEASVALLPAFWTEMATKMTGALVMIAPARDVVLFADSAEDGAVAEIVALAREIAAQASHPVSTVPLRWTGEGWAPYRD